MSVQDLNENQIVEFTGIYGQEFMDWWAEYTFVHHRTETKFRCSFDFTLNGWHVIILDKIVAFIEYSDSIDEFRLEELAIELSNIENRYAY